MKGVTFNIFNDLVESTFGLPTWDAMLTQVNPKSQGIYTAAGNYDDEELFALVTDLSGRSQIRVDVLVRTFGAYMLMRLARLYPGLFKDKPTAKSLILSVDKLIHLEFRKLYPDALIPKLTYEDPPTAPGEPEQLVVMYQSPRKLCTLAEGLIEGTGQLYHTQISICHTQCMLHGHDHCRLELTFVPQVPQTSTPQPEACCE